MLRKLSIMLSLFLLLELANPRITTASGTLLADCQRPLILYSEYHSDTHENRLLCLTRNGPKDLGITGWGFTLSPLEHYAAYLQEHGPNHRNGKELFGDQTLYVYDMARQVITSWHTGYGNIQYWWLDDTQLLVSRWVDNLGAYFGEYPIFYIFDAQSSTSRQLNWANLRLMDYIPAEKRLIFSNDYNSNSLFTVVLSNENDVQPFFLPKHASPYHVVASPDGRWIAYDIEDSNNAWCFTSTEILDRRDGSNFNTLKALCNDQQAIAGRFSDDGEFLSVNLYHNGEDDIGVYRMADLKLIFQFRGNDTGGTPAAWLSKTHTLILVKNTTTHFDSDLYSFDATIQRLSRLTHSLGQKSLP